MTEIRSTIKEVDTIFNNAIGGEVVDRLVERNSQGLPVPRNRGKVQIRLKTVCRAGISQSSGSSSSLVRQQQRDGICVDHPHIRSKPYTKTGRTVYHIKTSEDPEEEYMQTSFTHIAGRPLSDWKMDTNASGDSGRAIEMDEDEDDSGTDLEIDEDELASLGPVIDQEEPLPTSHDGQPRRSTRQAGK